MRQSAIWVILIVLVLGGIAGLCWKAHSQSLDLTKQEALQLMDLQYRVVMAAADRDEFIKALYAKYGIKQTDYNLDVKTGKFMPVEKKNDAKK